MQRREPRALAHEKASWILIISIAWENRSAAAARRGGPRLDYLLSRATNAILAPGGVSRAARGLWPDSNPIGVICPRVPCAWCNAHQQNSMKRQSSCGCASTFELGPRSLLSTRGIPHVLLHFFSASLLQGETEMKVSTDPADRNR